jgi:hypothetical protein
MILKALMLIENYEFAREAKFSYKLTCENKTKHWLYKQNKKRSKQRKFFAGSKQKNSIQQIKTKLTN